MIRHCVLCRFRDDVTQAQKARVYASLDALKEIVPGILGASFGPNASPEGLAKGFEDGFIIDFEGAPARDAYLVHPDHRKAGGALVELLDGGTEGLMVFDLQV